MARNSEKAMAMLSRWTKFIAEEGKEKPKRRPFLATECNDLQEAEKWRHQVIREISKKVAQIQNAGLGEFRLRDLNDEINKLLREKRHWQDRILALGGPDYQRIGPKMLDYEGKELPGNRGYKYFGAARELPGVRELFESAPPEAPRKKRGELYKYVDADYYGYRDEDDGILVKMEAEIEKQAIADEISAWKAKKESGELENDADDDDIYSNAEKIIGNDVDEPMDGEYDPSQSFVSHVPVPSQREVEELLVRRKKQELLEKYASETLISQSNEAKTLLGL